MIDLDKNKLNILIIANLEHASPRIPGLSQYLCLENNCVRVVTPLPDSNYKERWAIGALDQRQFQLVEAPYMGDILQVIRRMLWWFGLSHGKSLTEQLKVSRKNDKPGSARKESFFSKLRRKLPNWLLYRYQEIFGIPDLEITWYKSAYNTANNEIIANRPDVIISSSPYATSHLVASRLVKRHNIPWIADFRDTWSNNPAYPFSNLRRKLDTFLEKFIVSRADMIITVSSTYSKKLNDIHNRDISVISNGYTRLNRNTNLSENNDKRLNIVYTGTIYEGYQNYQEFLAGVRCAIDSGSISDTSLKIDFYGRFLSELDYLIEALGLSECVFQHGVVSREEAFKVQADADLLLFFNWEGLEVGGLSHLKLYEYLGAMKPIFVSGAKNDLANEKLVADTNSGFVGIGRQRIGLLITDLAMAKLGAGISYQPDMDELLKHSYFERGRDLNHLIKTVLQKKGRGKARL